GNDSVDCRTESHNFDVDFLRRNCDRAACHLVEFEFRITHIDVVRRWIRDRTVDPEDGKLDLLAGFDVAPNDQPVLGVPTFDDRATALSRGPRQLAVHPDLGLVVVGRCKYHGRASWLELPDSRRHLAPDAV